MVQTPLYLLIASSTASAGKSSTILGIAHQLQHRGCKLGYAKPIGTYFQPTDNLEDEQDLQFISQTLKLPNTQVISPLLFLDENTINQRLKGKDTEDYQDSLTHYCQEINVDLVILEGADNLIQGTLFNLSTPEIAAKIDASVLLVVKYDPLLLIDQILQARQIVGDRLLGVLINSIPPEELGLTQSLIKPFLQKRAIEVLGMLPHDRLLYSVSIRELVQKLKAKVLCREDRLDLMVESLTVGAMNVNSALEYFRQRQNMAVVTGGDRTDLQLAALEASTHCLILTGNTPPQPLILARAEDLEIPILSVDLDTLTTVEIVAQAFGKVRLHETIKLKCIQELIKQHFDLDKLISKLELG